MVGRPDVETTSGESSHRMQLVTLDQTLASASIGIVAGIDDSDLPAGLHQQNGEFNESSEDEDPFKESSDEEDTVDDGPEESVDQAAVAGQMKERRPHMADQPGCPPSMLCGEVSV